MWTVFAIVVCLFCTAAANNTDTGSECRDLNVVGWNSAAHASFDPAGWTIVFSGKVIPCNGVVSQWSYWAKVSQPFRAIVWRPTSVATEYTVVGINDIPAGAINEAVVYTVPKDQRFEVRQGDVIGLGWSDASPQTTWVVGGGGAAEVRWYRDADPSDLQPGDTGTTTGVQGRSWSFSALVTPKVPTKRTISEVVEKGKALLDFLAEFPDC